MIALLAGPWSAEPQLESARSSVAADLQEAQYCGLDQKEKAPPQAAVRCRAELETDPGPLRTGHRNGSAVANTRWIRD